MSHARTQVRDAVAAALTGLITTGANVYVNRAHLLESAKLPCLSIHVRNDATRRISETPIEQERTVELVVEAHANGGSVDDTLDTICAEVETAIGSDVTVGGKLIDCVLDSTSIAVTGEGSKLSGQAEMQFNATYAVREGAPEVLL